MAELKVDIPDELESELREFRNVDWSELAREAIRLKVLELELGRSRKLRHLLFKALISESKLTEKDALELGRKSNESMLKNLKSKGLV